MNRAVLDEGVAGCERWDWMRWFLPLPGLLLAGCVTVKAPDKPIEINLNINVKQEVVVSLKKDAEDFIANNPDLFPK